MQRAVDLVDRGIRFFVFARAESHSSGVDVGLILRSERCVRLEHSRDDQCLRGQGGGPGPSRGRDHGVVEVDNRRREELHQERSSARVAEGGRERDDLERASVCGTHGAPHQLRRIHLRTPQCSQ